MGSLLKKACGSNNPGTIKSSANDVYIKFKTDATNELGAGFAMYYYSEKSGRKLQSFLFLSKYLSEWA